MANTPIINYESFASANYANGPISITKPTGLEVGDVMFLFIFYTRFTSFNTPTGWTLIRNNTADFNNDDDGAIFYKVADSGDVAASSFSFNTSDGTRSLGGYIVRVSGFNQNTVFEQVSRGEDSTINTSRSHTVSVTPTTADSYLFAFVHWKANATASNYTSTGSPTWTELTELSGATAEKVAVVYAPYPSTTQVTNFSFDLTSAGSGTLSEVIMFVARTAIDSSGTTALLSPNTGLFAPTASAGAMGTTALQEVSPTFIDQNGKATSPTQWTNEAEVNTTWTNEDKL